jgi:Inositol monophosphatase family
VKRLLVSATLAQAVTMLKARLHTTRVRPCARAGRSHGRSRYIVARAAALDMEVTQEMLKAAQDCVDAAAAVTRPVFRSRNAMKVEQKADSSPVTEADKQAEMDMRAVIQKALPTHAIFGEEFGYSPGSGAL